MGHAAVVLLGVVLAASVSLSRPWAATEPGKCTGGDEAFKGYQAADPPRPVTGASFVDGRGALKTLAEYRGRGVVLNFWATWCAPCVKEMPQLDRLKNILNPDGITVLAISEDRAGAPLVEKFYRINDLRNLDVLIDQGGKVLRGSNVRGLPTTLLIDAEGREVGRVQGISEWDSRDVVAFLQRCLKP
jgi:thiol-disulfide isomerase/thioredoxin